MYHSSSNCDRAKIKAIFKEKKMHSPLYSPQEERLNIYSHFTGLILGVIGLIFLMLKPFTGWIPTLVNISYSLCVLALFLASTLYHSSTNPTRRKRLKIFDHCAIYLMIAGSYIPFLVTGIGDTWAYILLAAVWLLAITGIILKLFFTGRFRLISTISYVLLGWVVVIAIKPLVNSLSSGALLWLALGGVFYTLGAVLYQIKRIPFNHAIFHMFVLAGAYAHFHGIYWFL